MKSISKEIFIFALLLMIVVFMIGMAFYKFMPNNKMVPEPIEYTADSAISTILKEIAASTKYNYSNDEKEVENVIKSYSIGPKELNSAASKKHMLVEKQTRLQNIKILKLTLQIQVLKEI